jgi:hypothetical protein
LIGSGYESGILIRNTFYFSVDGALDFMIENLMNEIVIAVAP